VPGARCPARGHHHLPPPRRRPASPWWSLSSRHGLPTQQRVAWTDRLSSRWPATACARGQHGQVCMSQIQPRRLALRPLYTRASPAAPCFDTHGIRPCPGRSRPRGLLPILQSLLPEGLPVARAASLRGPPILGSLLQRGTFTPLVPAQARPICQFPWPCRSVP
jgi:hypothetical protein